MKKHVISETFALLLSVLPYTYKFSTENMQGKQRSWIQQ